MTGGFIWGENAGEKRTPDFSSVTKLCELQVRAENKYSTPLESSACIYHCQLEND